MVNFKIFDAAFHLYQSGEVYFLCATERAARFIAKDVEVRVEITPTGTKFNCGCTFHQKHMLQDKLCKRVIAVILYIYFKTTFGKRGKFE